MSHLYLFALFLATSFVTPTHQCGINFAFANYYGDTMVLQRGPASAVIWGYAFDAGDAVIVTINVAGQDRIYQTTATDGSAGRPVWRVSLDPIDAGGPYVITAASRDCVITLSDVLFGDVWLCSGQSNMDMPMVQIDDPQEDIADSVNYPSVRTLFTELATADTPQEDAILRRNWAIPNQVDIAAFSAVCWLFGKRLYEKFGVPIGLIKSSWGGTRIEAWSSPEALSVCFPDGVSPGIGANAESALYNSMIHPFQQMPIYGSIWYQGESNQNNYEDYACAQHEMVDDWRLSWFEKTGSTDPQFPFGVVQLAPNIEDSASLGFPNVRWAQTGAEGFLPTGYFQRFFMAVAIDLPDFDSPYDPIHPRYKRQIADRLALAAFPVAYGVDLDSRFQGPFPSSFVRLDDVIVITFDDGGAVLEGRDLETTTAYEVCCSNDIATYCTEQGINWRRAPIMSVVGAQVMASIPCDLSTQVVTGIRYAWSESPCPHLEQCAIYSTDDSIIPLPAPPFTFDGYIP